MIIRAIKEFFSVLVNPEKAFFSLKKKTLEDVVRDYFIILLIAGLVTGIVQFIVAYINAFYLDIFFSTNINYWQLSNFFFGRATSIIFLYLFIGVFIIFFLSIILKAPFRRIKYTLLLKILFYSLAPLLLFSWIPLSTISLIIWSIFLFFVGIKQYNTSAKIDKNSINYRD